MKKKEYLLILIILFLGLVLRLYKIDRPIADWHSWRQADTAAVSRNFIKDGYTPFVPRYDDMSSQTNTKDNPERFRFVEFPIYNSLIYFVWLITGVNTAAARLVTVFITVISTAALYFIVKHFSGIVVAAISAFLFATLPYNVFYSSAILPGPMMVLAILGLYLSFINWLEKGNKFFYLLSIVFANIAILTWPIAIFFMLPLLYLSLEKYKTNFYKKISLWVFAVLSLAPFIAWRIWMLRFPEGIPNFQFLLNDGNIRFKGAFFRWLVAERIGKLILTVGGFALFIIGLATKPKNKENLFYLSWLTSAILYFTVFASGNVRHDYYQIAAVPILVIFTAKGFISLISSSYFNQSIARVIAIFLFILVFAFGFYEIRGYYWVNKPQIVEAGMATDRLLPKDATVIAPYGGDTAFLYQTNRRGYPLVDRPMNKFVDQGTKYFVSVDPNDSGVIKLVQKCHVLQKTADFVIIELSRPCLN